MAYRFLLEVPEPLAAEASVAVESVDDAQVVLVRPSHGLGIDDPFVDMTVAAHSLRLIDVLYDWIASLPVDRPPVRLVLHSGDRIPLAEVDRHRMVALIREDQPWVERTIPKVGEHEPTIEPAGFTSGPGAPTETRVREPLGLDAAMTVMEPALAMESQAIATEVASGPQIRAINYVLIQVNDLAKAEGFYQDFFGMTLLGRIRRDADGAVTRLPADYTWQGAMQTGELADITYLQNGPLALAVQRMGLGVMLSRGAVDLVSIGVDAKTFSTLKGEVLMRPLTMISTDIASFIMRDPFNVNWEIAAAGTTPLLPV
jgi:hypothetical protein